MIQYTVKIIYIFFGFFFCWGIATASAIDLITINNDYYAQSIDTIEDVFENLRESGPAGQSQATFDDLKEFEESEEDFDSQALASLRTKTPIFASSVEDIEGVMEALNQKELDRAGSASSSQESLLVFSEVVGEGQESAETPSQMASVKEEQEKVLESFSEESLDQDSLSPSYEPSKEEPKLVRTKFNMTQGYRHDDLRVSHGYSSGGPNILSELTWTDIQSYEVKGEGQIVFKDFLRLEGSYAYGWIQDGDWQDSDYLGNNRTEEFSRSNNSNDGDEVKDYSFGAGLEFPITSASVLGLLHSDKAKVTLLGGYSESWQNFRMTDGNQTIPATGPFGGLNSTYRTHWSGPWAGVEFSGEKGKLNATLRGEYRWARYYGEGNWNLRENLEHPKSFEQISSGGGVDLSLGLGYFLTPNWQANFNVEGAMMETKAGMHRQHVISGPVELIFNECVWNSYSIRLGATYLFP
mgnify:CR=1 FL=1